MARKTIDIATIIDMTNRITTSDDFHGYEREIVCGVLEAIIEKSGNKVKFTSLSENEEDFKREYTL